MRYVVQAHSHKRIVIDPVSIGKARKLYDFVGLFHTIKCNRMEASFLSDHEIVDLVDVSIAAQNLLDKGLKQFLSPWVKKVHIMPQEIYRVLYLVLQRES